MSNQHTFPSLESRFWIKVQIIPGDCWPWTGARFSKGYGVFWLAGTNVRAHRMAYELTCGPIPEGMEIDHLCNNPSCCNPAHLEAVTPAENARRTRREVCKRGHPFTPENTIWERQGRKCRTCVNAGLRARRARVREAAQATRERGA